MRTPSPLSTDTTYVVRGAMYVLGSGFFFSLAGAAVKFAAATTPIETIVFFRNIFASVVFLPWLLRFNIESLQTKNLPLHIVRLTSGLCAMYCYYFAISKIPLSDAVLLNFTGPLFTPIIAFFWFKLSINNSVLTALFIGFIGVALIVQPEGAFLNSAALIGLVAGLLGGISVVAIWRMGAEEPATRIVFYYTAGSTIVSFFPMFFSGVLPRSIDVWGMLIASGILSALAHLLLAKGCTIASADRTNALSYGSVIFAAFIGWLFFKEQPGFSLILGTLLITASAILVARRHTSMRSG